MIALAVLVGATIVVAAIDVRTRRIPNALTAGVALCGLALHLPQGMAATFAAAACMLVAFAAGTLAFSAGWFGGGDVKLIAGCCAVAGYPGSGALVLDILAAGAILALGSAAVTGRLTALIRSTAAVAAHGAPLERNALPYGVAIAAGSALYALTLLVSVQRLP